MAFTVDYCTKDVPWFYTTPSDFGFINITIVGIRFENYTFTVTGTSITGPYTDTQTLNIFVPFPNPPRITTHFQLPPGTYTLVVTENSTSVSQSYTFVIGEYPETIEIITNVIPISCLGDAMVEISYTTGEFASMNYTFGSSFGTINKTQVITLGPFPPGIYLVTLDAILYCSAPQVFGYGASITTPTKIVEIFTPPPGGVSITASSVDTICDTSVGSIEITSIGGTSPYTFAWTGPNGFTSTSQNIGNLEAGDYTVVVTDANGCTGTLTVTIVSLPDQNGCVDPIICYKAVMCDSDCFGTKTYYLTGADVSALDGFVINGLQIQGEVINPDACWTIEQTLPGESTPFSLPCATINIGAHTDIIDAQIYIDTPKGPSPIFLGGTIFFDTAQFVDSVVSSGNLDSGWTASLGATPTTFTLCAPDISYNGTEVTITYQYSDGGKDYILVKDFITLVGSPATGCYTALPFLGYNNAFSTCAACQPVVCPTPDPFERTIQEPVKIFYEVKESACDITVTKRFATAYSNMVKKIKYGIADCCNGQDITETWVNKQISNLQTAVVPGYNCRTVPMQGCSWLPLQGCEILSTPYDGTSILAIAGENLTYAKLVMLSQDGKLYLNDPFNSNNYQRAVGFTTMDVLVNQSTRILITGIISNPLWTLIPGAIYFAAANGGITSTIPTTGISQAIGIATDAKTLIVELKQPNIL